MMKVDKIIELVRCVVMSGKIKNEIPLSAIIIAPSESGKSEILSLFADSPNVVWANDLSSKPLVEKIIPKIEGGATHIMVPDFIKILLHNKMTSYSLITTLSSLTAEGLKDIYFYGMERNYNKLIRCGLITSITPEAFRRREKYWGEIGFMSRLIPITYKYSEKTKNEIHEYIKSGKYEKEVEKFKIPKRIKDVAINPDFEGELILAETRLRNSLLGNPTGFRLHKQLRVLAKAIAYPKKVVQKKDVDKLKELSEFINFNYKEI